MSFVVRGLVIAGFAAIVIFAAVGGTRRSDLGGADLAATSTNGAFTMSNSKDDGPIFQVSDVAPGGSTSGSVTIGNTGSQAGDFSLSMSNLSGSLLANQLDLTISDGSNTVYSGKLGAMPSIPLGTFAAGESRTYTFTATLPASSDDTYNGASMSVEYDWNGTSPEPPAAGGGGGTGGTGGTGGVGGSGGVGIPPSITGLVVSNHTFYIGSGLPRFSIATGTTISFRLSEPARVTFAFLQYANGRRLGTRCVLHRTTGRRCTITYTRGTLVRTGKAGLNKLRFYGRLSRTKTLRPGRYTLAVSAKDPQGNVSRTLKTTLTLLRRR